MKARKLITIEGEQRPYTDGEWVVYDPDGNPTGCMHATAKSGDDPVAAAREFWQTNAEAMKHLVQGYRIELMLFDRWKTEVYPRMFAPRPVKPVAP